MNDQTSKEIVAHQPQAPSTIHPSDCIIHRKCSCEILPDRLSSLYDHDCLLIILSFLSWKDLNIFSLTSRACHRIRGHPCLDQTRSGTIILGSGVSNAKELMDKARREHWSEAFQGYRTHLRLFNLTHLSANIDPINGDFLSSIEPLDAVTSLDCSMEPPSHPYDDETDKMREPSRSWFLAPFEDYVDKGFAQGLTLSMLVPNLKSIDLSYLPFTTIGIAWLTENNPNLEVIRWNRSLIWPISNESEHHMEAFQNLREIYLDDARMIFCAEVDESSLWTSLQNHTSHLERVSLLGTRWYRNGHLARLSQGCLVKFVKSTPSLRWFRSDLSRKNIHRLKKDHPDVTFVSSSGFDREHYL